MEFTVGDMVVTTADADGDDRAIEFLVTSSGTAEEAHFVIHREHDRGWEAARLTVGPESGGVPVAAVEWAVEFAREYL
ncbi:hypothetical protein ACIGFK_06255 [Streptomyces sp. NPDC085524]|uniref:hypothetical protein n=1 Tax=unclassified Streptomyces TaxID=2593676 RepID=UPI0035D7343C